MSSNAPVVTGHLLAIDAEQRRDAIAAACRGRVTLLSNTASVWEALRFNDGVKLVDADAAVQGEGTLVACAWRSDFLGEAEAARIVDHVAAGGDALLDVVPDDPVVAAVRTVAGDAFAVRAQALVAISVLDGDLDATGAVELDLAGERLAPHAHRAVVFAGAGVAQDPPAEQRVSPVLWSAVPPSPQLAHLEQRVQELELTNRRLAQGRLGVHDAAAARAAAATGELSRMRARVAELEQELESAVFHARQNDELFQDARRQLLATTAELRRHQIDPKALVKRVLAKLRNAVRGR